MKRRLLFAAILTVLFGNYAGAQKQGQALIDSVLAVLPNTTADTNRVALLDRLSNAYMRINTTQGLKYGIEAQNLAGKLKWNEGIARSDVEIGSNYMCMASYPRALEYYEKALTIYDGLGNKKGIEHAVGNIGYIYYFQNEYPEALRYYERALAIAEEIDDKKGMGDAAGAIGNIYDLRQDFSRALEYFFKELKIDESRHDTSNMAADLGSIGSCYSDHKDYADGFNYTKRSLAMARQVGDTYLEGKDLENIGVLYIQIATDSTLGQTHVSFKKLSVPGNKKLLIDSAITYLAAALNVEKQTNDAGTIMEIYQTMSEAYKEKRDYEKSLEYVNKYLAIKDSVYTTENRTKIADIEARHEREMKDKQIEIDKLEIAKKKNERWFFVVIILFLTVIGILFIARQRLKHRKLEAEKKNAEAELTSATALLNTFRQSVQEKNAIIERFSGELEKIRNSPETETELLSKLETAIILTDEQWENFRQTFEKVHHGFFSKLKKKIPDITQAEIRFLALTKLKLSSKEMAAMLGISLNAIRVYRYRLRKRLDMDKDDMIEELVENL